MSRWYGCEENDMTDLLFIGLVLAFFAIAELYVLACDRL